jgi:hypothetical protein
MDISESLQVIAERYRAPFSLKYDPNQQKWSIVLGDAAIVSGNTADEVVHRILLINPSKVRDMMHDMAGGTNIGGMRTTEVGLHY